MSVDPKDTSGVTNSVDESKLTPQELKLYKLYGKLPSKNEVLISHKLKERKYFDSGDYALNKAGVKDINTSNLTNKHLTPEQVLKIHRNSISGANNQGSTNHLNGGGITGIGRKSSLENETKLDDQ